MHNGDSKGYAEKHRSNSKKAFQDSPLTFSNTPKATNFPRNGKESRSQSVEMVRDYQDDMIIIVVKTMIHSCLKNIMVGGMVETVEDHSSVEVTGLAGLQIKVYVPTSFAIYV